jgi:hypothetical protein
VILTNKYGKSIELDIGPNLDSVENVLSIVGSIRSLKNEEDLIDSIVRDFIRNCGTLEDTEKFAQKISTKINEEFFIARLGCNFILMDEKDIDKVEAEEFWTFNPKNKKFYKGYGFGTPAGHFTGSNYF